MTACQQVLASGGSGPNQMVITLADTKAGSVASASLRLDAAGSVSLTGNGSSCSPPYWWGAGAGAPTFYATLTVGTAPVPTSGPAALAPTSGNPTWVWTTTGVQTLSGTATLRLYSDAAGTLLMSTNSVNVNVVRSS